MAECQGRRLGVRAKVALNYGANRGRKGRGNKSWDKFDGLLIPTRKPVGLFVVCFRRGGPGVEKIGVDGAVKLRTEFIED